jgi:sulfur relay (sulfurtransferase) DsrC/TusE family protein
MIKKYLKIKEPDVIKIEAWDEPWEFYCDFLVMWEEIKLRLDEKWFFRNQQSQADNLADTIKIQEERNRRRPNLTDENWEKVDINKEELYDFKIFQKELRKKTTKRIDYIVVWLDANNMYNSIVQQNLSWFSDEVCDVVDDVIKDK